MATATSSVASATGSSASAAARPQLRGTTSGTAVTGNRRPTQSPNDGSQQRRNPSHKGWQTNSGQQQKYNGNSIAPSSSPTPGQVSGARTRPNAVATGETDTQEKHMHDRMIAVLAGLMGNQVTITVSSGGRYTGVLCGADLKNGLNISLKWTKLKELPQGENENQKVGDYVGGGPEKVEIFENKDIVDLEASNITICPSEVIPTVQQNGASGGSFKTDTDISGNIALRERELRPWQPDESTESGLSLDEQHAGPGQGWNQFEANERLFGVKSDYDETIYTTELNRSHPQFRQLEAKAAKIAAEIEGSNTGLSAHVAEERGLAIHDDSGMDEEDKYSGVQRTISSSTCMKYTPPARRAPTGQPTVPGAPHDPAIISSQLVRPESLQPKTQPQQPPPKVTQNSAPTVPRVADDTPAAKPKERPALPPEVVASRLPSSVTQPTTKGGEAPQIEKEISLNFKNFVTTEKERVKKKRSEMAHRDRESKLKELKKFSESFTLKTEVPQDLVPILAKDKQKQAEIIEKAKLGSKANANNNTSSSGTKTSQISLQSSGSGSVPTKVLPPNSFAARDPEAFAAQTKLLLQNFPTVGRPHPNLSQNVRQVHQDKNHPVRVPIPIPEPVRQIPPTGPSSSNTKSSIPISSKSITPTPAAKKFNANARPFEFKPNPSAAAFTPGFGAPSTVTTPSPTTSAHPPGASRAPSPSVFFGSKRIKTAGDRPSIKRNFNPFMGMKKNPKKDGLVKQQLVGNANDFIDKPWSTTPLWPNGEPLKEKSYKDMFGKIEFDQSVHSPQPPHIMPPQPQHPQMPPHMQHMAHPPHVPHQAHHGPMQHLLPPHYEQEAHMRQMSSPSVMPASPSLHSSSVAAYQQSPVPHNSQLAMYGPQGQMGHYGVPGAPGGHQYFYNGTTFRGANGPGPMMMQPQGPVPYPAAQMMHPQMYSPQQPQAYMTGPAPSSGFPSPRPSAPMMMHGGSSQGTSGGPQMVAYGIQHGQNYGAQGQQQQSEFLPPGQNWLPQRSQSTVPFSSAVSSPRLRHKPTPIPSSATVATSGTPLLSPALAAFASSPTLAPVQGFSSQPLQRSQTSNKAQDVGDGGRGYRGRGGRGYHGHNSNAGRGRGNMGRGQDNYMMDVYSNESSMNAVGMMRGQPPPHQGGPPPPQQQYYGPPPGHFPPGRGNTYGAPQQGQHGMSHPSQQQIQVAPPQQQGNEGVEESS